jgi:hypothetical protein
VAERVVVADLGPTLGKLGVDRVPVHFLGARVGTAGAIKLFVHADPPTDDSMVGTPQCDPLIRSMASQCVLSMVACRANAMIDKLGRRPG